MVSERQIIGSKDIIPRRSRLVVCEEGALHRGFGSLMARSATPPSTVVERKNGDGGTLTEFGNASAVEIYLLVQISAWVCLSPVLLGFPPDPSPTHLRAPQRKYEPQSQDGQFWILSASKPPEAFFVSSALWATLSAKPHISAWGLAQGLALDRKKLIPASVDGKKKDSTGIVTISQTGAYDLEMAGHRLIRSYEVSQKPSQ